MTPLPKATQEIMETGTYFKTLTVQQDIISAALLVTTVAFERITSGIGERIVTGLVEKRGGSENRTYGTIIVVFILVLILIVGSSSGRTAIIIIIGFPIRLGVLSECPFFIWRKEPENPYLTSSSV